MNAVHRLIHERVDRDGAVPMGTLVESVSRETGEDTDEVTASVWDLMQNGVLTYGADAHVRMETGK